MFGQWASEPMDLEEALLSRERGDYIDRPMQGCCSACASGFICIAMCAPCPTEPREPVEQGTIADQSTVVLKVPESPVLLKVPESPALELPLTPKPKIPTPVVVGGAAALAWLLLGA